MQLARIRLYLKIKIKKTYVYTSPQNKRRFMLLIEQDISFIAPSRKKNNKLINENNTKHDPVQNSIICNKGQTYFSTVSILCDGQEETSITRKMP